jgi:hypothetical protein
MLFGQAKGIVFRQIRRRIDKVLKGSEDIEADVSASKYRPRAIESLMGAICLVRPRRLELPRAFAHNDLNVARLPIPPWPQCP